MISALQKIKRSKIVFSIYFWRWTLRKILKWKIIDRTLIEQEPILFGSEKIHFKLPEGFGKTPDQILEYDDKNLSTKPVYTKFIENIDIIGPNCVPITEDGKLIITNQAGKLHHLDKCSPKFFMNPDRYACDLEISEAVCLVNLYNNEVNKNYFHWYADSLSQLVCLKELGHTFQNLKVIVPSSSPPVYLASLFSLGVRKDQLIVWEGFTKIKVKRFFTFSTIRTFIGPHSLISPAVLFKFREFYFNTNHNAQSQKRIFISREGSRGRKIINWEEIEVMLKEYGFSIITLENLSFSDQVSTFSSANIIIGAHGAGLTNLIFSNPETKVLELFGEPPNHYTEYFKIASSLNLNYYFLHCQPVYSYAINSKHYKENDLFVEEQKFESILKYLCS